MYKKLSKRLLATSILTLIVVAGPIAASALSVSDLQAQIKDLLVRISQMQGQSSASITSTVSSDLTISKMPRLCGILNRNIGQGVSGDDVRGLQEFLASEGVFSVSATGYFGPATARALAQWQAKEGVQSVGSVGPLTRERIKMRCGGHGSDLLSVSPQMGQAPLTVTVTARTGDMGTTRPSWVDGQDTLVDFGDGTERQWVNCDVSPTGIYPARCVNPVSFQHTYAKDGTYVVSIVKAGGMCIGGCKESVLAQQKVAVGSTPIACTKEYKPVCGAKQVTCITAPCNPVPTTYGNLCTMRADGASYLYDGACRDTSYNPEADTSCKSWNDGCNTCSRSTPGGPAMCTLRACTPESMTRPYCTAHFDGTTTGGAPSISRFSGPVSLGVNEIGTWSIAASDPENGRLSYSIVWGDEWARSAMAGGTTSAESSIMQQTTFTHAYANPGNYTVSINVTDESGKTAQTSASVSVSQSVCTTQYEPMCGRPTGCANTCAPGMMCTMECRMHNPVTYSNRCQLNNANASFLHAGVCTGNETY